MTVKRKGKLKGLKARVENGAKAGLILAGDLVAQRAARRAHVVTGRLRRSITRGNPVLKSGGMSISVGSNLSYAKAEEFREGEKGGTSHSYLRPALEESKKEVTRLIASRILAAILRP